MACFVTWCNGNAGFFSLLLSVIAVITSIFAISAQNKSTVFKERLSIYSTTLDMYRKGCRIVEICKGKRVETQKKMIALVMFDLGSDEQKIIEKCCQGSFHENDEKAADRFKTLMDRYTKIYFEKYMNDSFVAEAEIFYEPVVYNYISKLYGFYDDMRLCILACEQEEINTWIDDFDCLLKQIQQKHILEKMKRKLPL